MRIAILGYGVEGKSAEKFLKREFEGAKLEIRDIKLRGKNYLKGLENFDMIVRSPGIPYFTSEIQKAKKAGVKISSTTKLFFRYSKGTIIGITGTKGKGTTATLLYNMLKAAGKKVYLAGNIGAEMLDLLSRLTKNSITILELSSFQLQDLDISPHIAIVLYVSPDHLNHHKNFKEYLNAKARIVNNPPPSSTINPTPTTFYFTDNKYSKLIAQKCHGKKVQVFPDKNQFFSRSDLKIAGYHNVKNAVMAATVAKCLGVSKKNILKTIKKFRGLPHRLEFVREIRGVKFYNDSASTNPAAAAAALSSFDAPKIWIAGGQSKGVSFRPLKKTVEKSNIKLIILYGENRHEIAHALGKRAKIKLTADLKSALKEVVSRALRGDIILLSPASTAFDQFSGYGERGEIFKKIVKSF